MEAWRKEKEELPLNLSQEFRGISNFKAEESRRGKNLLKVQNLPLLSSSLNI